MENFKCKCGCSDFKMDVIAHDLDVYGITVDLEGNVDLVELLNEYVEDSDYSDSMECFDCKAKYSAISLKPLAECEKYARAERMRVYVDGGGVVCPFCESHNIEAQNFEADAGVGLQGVVCKNCEKEWTDRWSLVEVIEDEEEERKYRMEEPFLDDKGGDPV